MNGLIGIRAIQDEQIWKARHRHAHVGARVVAIPAFAEIGAIFPQHLHRHQELGRIKTSGEDEDIELLVTTIRESNARLIDFQNARACNGYIVAL